MISKLLKGKKTPSSSLSNNSRDQAPVHVSAAGNNKSMQLSTDDIPCVHYNDVINGACLKCDICDNTNHGQIGHCIALPHDMICVTDDCLSMWMGL